MRELLDKIKQWFRIPCPNCQLGSLHQDAIHIMKTGTQVNVYKCDECNSEFV